MKIKICAIILILSIKVSAQTVKGTDDFVKYVSKNYALADELKYNCEWMYALVKIRTNAQNKVIKFEFLNSPSDGVKKGFNILMGYQFPKKMKINGHPIVFYLSIDNSDNCIEKPGDIRFYSPNKVVNEIVPYYLKIFKEDPYTIVIPETIMKLFYKTQQ